MLLNKRCVAKYFGRACEEDITEVSVHVTHFCEKETPGHDDDLLPFYHANPELVGIYKDFASSDVSEERNTTVRRYLDCISYVKGIKMIRSNTDDKRFVADNCNVGKDMWVTFCPKYIYRLCLSHIITLIRR